MAPVPRIPRQLHQPRAVKPHPRRGGSTGYSLEFRQAALASHFAGGPALVSKSTIERWIRRVQPEVKTGNKATPELSGEYETMLVFHRLVFPRATADEVIAFIAQNAVVTRIFSRQRVYEADARLGLTKKIVS
ncbi:hypothetical protein B484DRAFT_401188, partial [Ochromonadaceae sp. CCMP2298]